MDALERAAAAERFEETLEAYREQIAFVSGLLADYVTGIPPNSEKLARSCAREMLRQVQKNGIAPKRVFTEGP